MLPVDVGTEEWFEIERMCVSGRLETLNRWRITNGKTDDMQQAVTNEILERDMDPTSGYDWARCAVVQISKEMGTYLKTRHPEMLENKYEAEIIEEFANGTLYSGDSFPIGDIDRLHYDREPNDLAETLVALIKCEARRFAHQDITKLGF